MKVLKYATEQYSVNWMMLEANTVSNYINQGVGKAIQWIYILQGSITLEYNLNSETKQQILGEDDNIDLRSLSDSIIKFVNSSEDCYLVAVIPKTEQMYKFNVYEIDNNLELPAENKDRILIPINSIAKINNREVKQYHSARVLANKKIKIWTPEIDSAIVVFSNE